MSPFKSCVLDTGSENMISIPFSGWSMRTADRKRKLFFAGDQNAFVLGTVDACRIAFGGNFQLVIFRFFGYLTDAECVSGRVICLGDLNRIAFVLFRFRL